MRNKYLGFFRKFSLRKVLSNLIVLHQSFEFTQIHIRVSYLHFYVKFYVTIYRCSMFNVSSDDMAHIEAIIQFRPTTVWYSLTEKVTLKSLVTCETLVQTPSLQAVVTKVRGSIKIWPSRPRGVETEISHISPDRQWKKLASARQDKLLLGFSMQSGTVFSVLRQKMLSWGRLATCPYNGYIYTVLYGIKCYIVPHSYAQIN